MASPFQFAYNWGMANANLFGWFRNLFGSSNDKPDVVRRDEQPDMFNVPQDDEEMNFAVEKSRETMETFIRALQSPAPGQTMFSVKKPFLKSEEGDDAEHIWLVGISFDGESFWGEVGNDPVDVKAVRCGDRAQVSKAEISDWMFNDRGKLAGGYTIRVLYNRYSEREKKQFVRQTGMQID